jgi:hypothetical protein
VPGSGFELTGATDGRGNRSLPVERLMKRSSATKIAERIMRQKPTIVAFRSIRRRLRILDILYHPLTSGEDPDIFFPAETGSIVMIKDHHHY